MNAYDKRHARRYQLSLEALRPLLRPGMKILECGARSIFADTLERECSVEVEATANEDLRHLGTYPADEAPILDAIICMEVLEHLHDQERELPTEWAGTGVTAMFSAITPALKSGGLLFLTTPNACSTNVLHKLLHLQPPMVYRPHVREYGPHELAAIAKAAGFERITVTSCDPWGDSMSGSERARLEQMMADLGYRTDCRGEDLFLTAFKSNS